jgi:hypothetical protein
MNNYIYNRKNYHVPPEVPISKWNVFYFWLVLLTIAGALTFAIISTCNRTEQSPAEIEHSEIDSVIVDLSIWEYIQQCKIEHPHIVYSQYKIESGHGTSRLFLKHNNLFGMKYPTRRPTTASQRTHNGYSSYECWKHSIHDYALWQAMYARGKSEEEYLQLLSKIYATDTLYIRKILLSL